jgi:hypothetical protein
LEVFRGKMVFSGGSEEFLEFLEWLEDLGAKYSALAKFGKFSEILLNFGGFRVV